MSDPTKPNPKDTNLPPLEPKSSAPAGSSFQLPITSAPKKPANSSSGKRRKAVKPKDPHRWRKRVVRTILFLVFLGLGLQVLLWALIPWTLRRAAKFYDLDLTCDRPDLALLNSDAGLWHVKVSQHGNLVASVDYCRADISLLNLFRGRLVIQRLEADGVDLTVQRDTNGEVPLLKSLFFSGQQNSQPSKTSNGKPGPIDLRPPVAIDALVLSRVRTHIVDNAVTPALDTQLQMNLRLTDIGSPVCAPKFSLELIPTPLSAPLLDLVSIEAGSRKVSDAQSLDAYFSVTARGLHPRLLAGYLAPLGIKVTGDGVALSAHGTMTLNVIPNHADAITGSVNLSQLAITADGQDAATMKSVTVDIDSCGRESAAVKDILLADGTFLAERTPAGAVRVAGFEFSGENTTTPTTQPTEAPSAPFLLNVGELSLKNFRASFKDAAVKPAADVEFMIDDISLKNISNDPKHADKPIAIAGKFSAPGILRNIIVDGTCNAAGDKKSFALTVDANGIHPDALGPYFAMMGVDSTLQSGRFLCKVEGDVSQSSDDKVLANAKLSDIRFDDEGDEHVRVRLDDVSVRRVGLSPGAVKIDEIAVSGPSLNARREKNGAIWAAGFKLNPSERKSTASAPASTSAATQPAIATGSLSPTTQSVANPPNLAALPKIDIGKFRWSGVKLKFDDQFAQGNQTVEFSVDDAGIELNDLHVDFDSNAPGRKPAHLKAYLIAPGLAGNLSVEGAITQKTGGLTADVDITGKELSAMLTGPYLKAMRVEPTLKDGSLRAKAHVDVTQLEDGIAATAKVTDFALSDPSGELLAADSAGIEGVHMTANMLSVQAVSLQKPRGRFSREAGGAIDAIGFKLLPAPPEEAKSKFTTDAGPVGIAKTQAAEHAASTTQASPSTQPAEGPQILVLKKFSIDGGAFAWNDQAVAPAADLMARVDGHLSDLTWGKPADPANLDFTLKADGILNEAKIRGTLLAAKDHASARLDVNASGLRQGGLVSYLPPGMKLETKDGRFATHVEANVKLRPAGGLAAGLLISDLDFRDGGDAEPLVGVDSMKVNVNRYDPGGKVIDIDEISVTGVQSRARKDKDGTIHAMGIALSPATQPTTQPATASAPAATQPAVALAPTTAPAAPGETTLHDRSAAAPALKIDKPKYPLVTVNKLDVGVKHFAFADESRAPAPPISVSDLHLSAAKPIAFLGDDPMKHAPAELALSLKVDDIVDSAYITLKLAPFADKEPWVGVDIVGTGIHGAGLIAQVPDLKEKIDASHLTDGQLHAYAFAKLMLDRFDPMAFPLDRAFGAEVLLKKIEFRDGAGGPVLGGVDEIRAEKIHVQPADRKITLKTVEIDNIVGRAARETDGIHAFGVVLKVAAPATQPTTAPTIAPATAAAQVASAAPMTAPSRGDGSEIAIDRLMVSGLDLVVTDNTVSPPLLVPINSLDAEVRNFSTKAFVEPRKPTRFSVLVGAGKVPLPAKMPKPTAAQGAAPVAGLMNLGAAVTGKSAPKPAKGKPEAVTQLEDRDLFSQIQADGELTFYPQPKGWIKASVSAFDLAELSSTARPMKVDLNNGVFDEAVDVRMPGDGSMNVDAHSIFTDLELSEPSGGPIQKYLGLDAAINVVIGLLVRPDDSIDVPLSFKVEKNKISSSEIRGAAVHAFGAIVGSAIASEPVKAANAVGGLVNTVVPLSAIFGAPKPKFNGPFTLAFAAGDDALSAEDFAQLNIVLQRMKEEPDLVVTLTSEITGGPESAGGDLYAMTGDIGRARLRANPSQEECRELINRLSRRKDDLIRRRLDVLGEARGEVASRSVAGAKVTLERLRAVERELAATEDALDRLYDLERPGANRQAGRRTRQAALAVANSRQKAISDYLESSGLPDIKTRINETHPKFAPIASDPMAGGATTLNLTVKKKS